MAGTLPPCAVQTRKSADGSDSINKTGVISPRYNVRIVDFEKWVVKLLPSRQFGYIVLTTSAGIMDHEEARRKHVAGKIIGYEFHSIALKAQD